MPRHFSFRTRGKNGVVDVNVTVLRPRLPLGPLDEIAAKLLDVLRAPTETRFAIKASSGKYTEYRGCMRSRRALDDDEDVKESCP